MGAFHRLYHLRLQHQVGRISPLQAESATVFDPPEPDSDPGTRMRGSDGACRNLGGNVELVTQSYDRRRARRSALHHGWREQQRAREVVAEPLLGRRVPDEPLRLVPGSSVEQGVTGLVSDAEAPSPPTEVRSEAPVGRPPATRRGWVDTDAEPVARKWDE